MSNNSDDRSFEYKLFKALKKLHINPYLIMLKITLFTMFGATASLLPYLTIHMQSIGLTVDEISMVYLAMPLTTFLSPPITGYLIDKFGQYKPVMFLSLILNAVFHHSLLLIPHMEMPGDTPSAYVFKHPETGRVEVWWSPCPSRECPEAEELDMVLADCIDHCMLKDVKQEISEPPVKTTTTPIPANLLDFEIGSTIMVGNLVCSLRQNITPSGKPKDLHFLLEVEKDKKRRKQRRKKQGRPAAPATGLEFPHKGPKKSGVVAGFFLLDMHPHLAEPPEHLGIEVETDDNETLEFLDRAGGPDVCPPDYKESDDRTFWIYFFLRFFGTVMLSGGVTMLDPIALTMIQKYDYTDYSAAFYTYDILLVISAVTILLMPIGVNLPADNIMRDLLRIVRLPPVLLFIFFMFSLGNFWGFIESFLFLYLKELGATNYLLGITVTVGSLSSIPFLYGAGKIMKKFGHVNIIIIAFFSHAAPIEALAVHLMWIAAATYCSVLAPKTLLATLIGVLGMAHFSLESGEGDHLNSEAGDTAAPSVEKLSFMIEMNNQGSMMSLNVLDDSDLKYQCKYANENYEDITYDLQLNSKLTAVNSIKYAKERLNKKQNENTPKPTKAAPVTQPIEQPKISTEKKVEEEVLLRKHPQEPRDIIREVMARKSWHALGVYDRRN
ncbi:hypothetical protein C0J52_09859 [Blattella germanica]|nr:hypothetical protein C0J52_09859 [Blattella germanica]